MKHWEAEYPHVEDGSDVLGEAMSVVRNQIWSLHLFVYFYPSCSHFLYLPAVPFLQRESRGAVSCQGTCISQGGPVCSSDVRNPLKLLDFLKKGRIYTSFSIAYLQFVLFCFWANGSTKTTFG